MTNNTHDLTETEMQAVEYFVDMYGSRWKRELRKLWDSGTSYGKTDAVLYSLRNAKGPTWLSNFSYAKAKAKQARKS